MKYDIYTTKVVTADNQSLFYDTLARCGLHGSHDPLRIWYALVGVYEQPDGGRYYHTIEHAALCVRKLYSFIDDCTKGDFRDSLPMGSWSNIALALWYHDAYYNIRSEKNEERSANLATSTIRLLGGDMKLSGAVGALIMATQGLICHHQRDYLIIRDIDYSILGESWETFLWYDDAIRREHRTIPRGRFAYHRRKFLTNTLLSEHIFSVPYFRERYEDQARKNILGILETEYRGEDA